MNLHFQNNGSGPTTQSVGVSNFISPVLHILGGMPCGSMSVLTVEGGCLGGTPRYGMFDYEYFGYLTEKLFL